MRGVRPHTPHTVRRCYIQAGNNKTTAAAASVQVKLQ